MNKELSTFMLAAVIGLLIVAIGLGFLFGLDNPIPWILIAVLVLILFFIKRRRTVGQLEWSESYCVGVKAMDDDHKKLINLLNRFQTAYEYHTGEEFERKALDELVEYTKYHFEHEEELLEEYNYPDLATHKEQHVTMIKEVDRFRKEYEQTGHESLQGVSNYLKGWLINHINGTDKQYSDFMNSKGGSLGAASQP